MHETEHIEEKVILVGIDTGNPDQAQRSLDELAELAKTAGAEVAGRLIQAERPSRDLHRKRETGRIKRSGLGDRCHRHHLRR